MWLASREEPAARCSNSLGDRHTTAECNHAVRACHTNGMTMVRLGFLKEIEQETCWSEQRFRLCRSCASASCVTHASHAQGGGDIITRGWCKRTGPAGEAFERESCGMALESEWGRLRAHRCPAQLSSVQDAGMSYCQSFPLLPRGAPTPATTLVGDVGRTCLAPPTLTIGRGKPSYPKSSNPNSREQQGDWRTPEARVT